MVQTVVIIEKLFGLDIVFFEDSPSHMWYKDLVTQKIQPHSRKGESMANKHIPLNIKIKAFGECLCLKNVEEVAKKYEINPNSIRYWFRKLFDWLPDILVKDNPGPRKKESPFNPFLLLALFLVILKRLEKLRPHPPLPVYCPKCQSPIIWRNGSYRVIDWKHFFMKRSFRKKKVKIQRYICSHCHTEIESHDRKEMARYRSKAKRLLSRSIAFSKFGLGLSLRMIQLLLAFFFNLELSLGYLNGQVQTIGKRARQTLALLNKAKGKVKALVSLADETFIKIKNNTEGISILMDNLGLVRLLNYIGKGDRKDIEESLKEADTEGFSPLFHITDFAKVHQSLKGSLFKKAKHIYCLVHAFRIIHRLIEEAIRNTTLLTPKRAEITKEQRKAQIKLKRRLLRKRLTPVKTILFEAFKLKDSQMARTFIEAGLMELETLPIASVKSLLKQLKKFYDKYLDVLLFELEQENLTITTNPIESFIGTIKAFAKQARSYQSPETAMNNLAGRTLFENFAVRKRGPHKGSSGVQRSQLEYHAKEFFEAVAL